ncbi:hypothetical protein AURDEDRAFT_186281 [Auricularia subglabra TFB-10046 SS5]|nr:hypothetical protein AURDEDRAFT_186281 [Auricularia subglabra TFB-10046 SS5]
MSSSSDGQELRTVTFEWKLRGLKALFDGSKGDTKSKVTKSIKFDKGRWQILFYANSGTAAEPTTFCSLYLSCEPTVEEQDTALSGKWSREGKFSFSFELCSCEKNREGKRTIFTTKDAPNHAFSYKTANWGWATFARRDAVYYSLPTVVANDAFVIVCSITGAPHRPPPPRALMLGTGALLDDPDYSDVCFALPGGRKVRAMKKLLARRSSYFESMFGSGFSETLVEDGRAGSPAGTPLPELDVDSDFEDDADEEGVAETQEDVSESPRRDDQDDQEDSSSPRGTSEPEHVDDLLPEDDDEEGASMVLPQLPPSPPPLAPPLPPVPETQLQSRANPNKAMTSVVVRDSAYSTYRALLYYLYTDMIIFAPLSSSFTPASAPSAGAAEPTTRRQWIYTWSAQHPDLAQSVSPCSAKSMYRLADKLNMPELKARAFDHIVGSLNVHNIVDEVFGVFAATFGEVRKVEMEFFLAHWAEIRSSDAMRGIWPAIRQGRHPGFEQVWPMIVMHLEFVPGKEDGAAAGEVVSVSA